MSTVDLWPRKFGLFSEKLMHCCRLMFSNVNIVGGDCCVVFQPPVFAALFWTNKPLLGGLMLTNLDMLVGLMC